MRKIETWKKVLFLLISFVIVLRIGYIAFRGEVDKGYYTSTSYDLTDASSISCSGTAQVFTSSQDRLNSLELVFSNISEDKAGIIILYIYSGEELIYQTNITLAAVNNGEWKKIYVNAELSPDKEYKIMLEPTEDCTQIPELFVVKDGWAPEITTSYSRAQQLEGQIAINYGYLKYPSVLDRGVMISLWMLLWILLSFILWYFDRIMDTVRKGIEYLKKRVNPQVLVTISEVLGCMIIINSSGIEFQAPTKVILYAISLIATMNDSVKNSYVKTLADASWKKTLLFLLYIYAAFALVGQRIWIYPLTVKLTLAGFFVFICTILWFIPVVNSLLYYLEKLSVCGFSNHKKWKTGHFILISIGLLIVPAAYNLFANNPGISSPDTVTCMITNARNIHGMYDWHSAFYCMLLRVIQEVWNSTYAVILVQYFFWTYVMTELMLYFRKKEIKESILLAVLLFSGLNAGNYIHVNTIWKDIPYTLSLLWALIIIAKLSIDFEEYKHKWYIYLELITAFVGMYLYRKNGVVTFIIITVPLALVLRKNRKLLVSLAVSIALICTIKGPIYDYFEIESPGRYGMYIGLSQDILGVYYAGGEVSEETLKMINVMTKYNNAEYAYNPTRASQSYDLDVEVKDFIWNYIDTFLKNPVIMTRAIIDREDMLWDIYIGQDSLLGCVNYTVTMDNEPDYAIWREYYPARKYVSLYPLAASASAYTLDSQWISAIVWRCGLLILLGLIALLYLFLKKGREKHWLIITPLIGHIIGLLLSTGWSDFRYYWPVNLLNTALILLTIVIGRNHEG